MYLVWLHGKIDSLKDFYATRNTDRVLIAIENNLDQNSDICNNIEMSFE